MCAAASDHDAFNGRLTGSAGLACAGVDTVVELEETSYTFGVDVVGDRGSA